MSFISSIVCLIGFFGFLRFLWYVFKIVYTYKSQPKNLKDKNIKWALITGASSGVGYELALKIADQGVNVIAIGRSKERLSKLENDVKSKNVNFFKLSVDFSDYQATTQVFPQIKAEIADQIGALFICHGESSIKPIEDFTDDEIEKYNNSHITSNVIIARDFVKQGGQILSVMSSANSFITTPYATQYGCVKRWMNSFYHILSFEVNTSIQIINSGFIKDTQFFSNIPSSLKSFSDPPSYALTPGRVADMLLATVGTGFEVDVGYDTILYRCLFWVLPPQVTDMIFRIIGNQISAGLKEKTE
ncbi:hypothetical protein TRFO_17534 [Tritrichomonas foetus]|uniref:Oxidoreductase, short chain dehydrogenase/reductase family protein n=1 Tax=Tritrichomonas foetus TaxID=1144522 RepID=A0A1J4KN15_9EUKA|nr:hypothetical protein TRFO_17534 [Tritrichomonas foetus]|eukprot:OHT12506.1 hypothetical protein TRFO_17534 [Tritrichomonas foetus]